MSESLDVIVVGGGIAGLTVAWRLRQQRRDLKIVVLETADRPGGKIHTELLEHGAARFLIELGADSMLLASKPWARELCHDLELDDEVVPVESAPHPTAIWQSGRAVDLPAGLSLLAPTQSEPLLRSPLLSQAGKARALREPEIPVREGNDDESLGSFVTRRFGREYLDAVAEPLLAGIYNANPDELSLLTSFPNFRKLEVEYGSVTRGAQRAQQAAGGPPFFALRNGIEQLPTTLAARLGPLVRTGCRVERIERAELEGYRVTLQTGEQLAAPAVVLATPASSARPLLGQVAPEAACFSLSNCGSASGAIVLAWPDARIDRPLPGFGLVIPKREGEPFNAITVHSRKYPGRAPAGWSLMRFFFGGYRSPQTLELDDDALLRAACDFAARAVGAHGTPAVVRIARWPEGSPIYQVDHLDTIACLEAALPLGLFLTGAAYRGPGIPDVVRSATELATRIAASLVPANV
jgi:oxygen-dependent protoporphyrinogen oxidase